MKSQNQKNIVFTGGGTSGHVTPNIAVIKKLIPEEWNISYIGSETGVEKKLIEKENIPFYGIASGKLRRYFSWQNFVDPIKIAWGLVQAYFILRKLEPTTVFSKGGFVAVPVVFAAWLRGIQVIVHESDLTPGLANRLSFPFAKKICLTFEETRKYIKEKNKIIVTGTPIRQELFLGDAARGRSLYAPGTSKKIILILGGGQGSKRINEVIKIVLPVLLQNFVVIHSCGAGKIAEDLKQLSGYIPFEYLHEELFDVFAAADIVVSRSGANTLSELLVLTKPHILIPLAKNASRGDQIHNATYTKSHGLSEVIPDEQLTAEILCEKIKFVIEHLDEFKEKLIKFKFEDGTAKIVALINEINLIDVKDERHLVGKASE